MKSRKFVLIFLLVIMFVVVFVVLCIKIFNLFILLNFLLYILKEYDIIL